MGRSRAVIVVLLAVSAVAILLVVLVLLPTRLERWEAIRARVTKLKAEARSRNIPRSVLRGKAIPGNAWDDYNIALNDTL